MLTPRQLFDPKTPLLRANNICLFYRLIRAILQTTEFSVKNSQVRGGYVILIGEVEGTIRVGDTLNQTVDEVRTL